ncbi:hypothetical protein KCP69_25630 [Salmonella enterica subsp. enterica]|nr:hypothetical protein KCP69_25630 [Salmonella enterica subsp. enterica]
MYALALARTAPQSGKEEWEYFRTKQCYEIDLYSPDFYRYYTAHSQRRCYWRRALFYRLASASLRQRHRFTLSQLLYPRTTRLRPVSWRSPPIRGRLPRLEISAAAIFLFTNSGDAGPQLDLSRDAYGCFAAGALAVQTGQPKTGDACGILLRATAAAASPNVAVTGY